MSWREVTEADLAWIEPFLREHVQSSMFFLSNLNEYGLNGFADRAMRIWALEVDRKGLFALSNGGMILMQAPMPQKKIGWRHVPFGRSGS